MNAFALSMFVVRLIAAESQAVPRIINDSFYKGDNPNAIYDGIHPIGRIPDKTNGFVLDKIDVDIGTIDVGIDGKRSFRPLPDYKTLTAYFNPNGVWSAGAYSSLPGNKTYTIRATSTWRHPNPNSPIVLSVKSFDKEVRVP